MGAGAGAKYAPATTPITKPDNEMATSSSTSRAQPSVATGSPLATAMASKDEVLDAGHRSLTADAGRAGEIASPSPQAPSSRRQAAKASEALLRPEASDDIEIDFQQRMSGKNVPTGERADSRARHPAGASKDAVLRAEWVGRGPKQLSLEKGAKVHVVEFHGDWAWCKVGNEEGWVPRKFLATKEAAVAALAGSSSRRSSRTPQGTRSGRAAASKTDQPGHGVVAPMTAAADSGSTPCADAAPHADAVQEGATGGSGDTMTPELPQQWSIMLANTMTLHTVQNAMRLAHYLLQLLTGGYGTASALHISCWKGSTEAVAAVTSGSRAIVEDYHSRPGELMPLHIAILCQHCGVVEYLLELAVNPNVQTVHELRALHVAALTSWEIAEVLVGRRADVSPLTADADTPLHYACCYSQMATMELLLRSKADASSQNNFGVAPLHVAAAAAALEGLQLRDARAVLLLCSHRADPAQPDRHGRTPVALAQMAAGHESLIEFLQASSVKSPDTESGASRTQKAARELLAQLENDASNSPTRTFDCDEPEPMPCSVRDGDDELDRAGFAPQTRTADGMRSARKRQAGTVDMRLAEENAALASEVARLKKELEASESKQKLLQELLDNSQGTVQQMKDVHSRPPVLEVEESKGIQAIKVELEQERGELRKRQEGLDEARQRWEEEKEALQRQIADAHAARDTAVEEASRLAAERDKLASRAEAAESALVTATAAAAESQERAAAASSRPASAVKRMEAELGEQATAISNKDMELQALKLSVESTSAELADAKSKLTSQDTDLQSLRTEIKRLTTDLQRQVKQYEEAWSSLSELRKQHTGLRTEHEQLQQSKQRDDAQAKEREVELEGKFREQDLRMLSLEKDNALQVELLKDMDRMRERAEYADRMLKPLEDRIDELHEAFDGEQRLRKRYHNQLQDLKGAIRVYARIRPVVPREAGQNVVVRKMDAFSMELDGNDKARKGKTFMFDSIFDDMSTQDDVFSECRSLVSSAIDGFNVTVFAYGQTGAGKTHTMYGSPDHPGLVPRIAQEIFQIRDRYAHECQTRVRCQMFELYRDDLVDLILPKAKAKSAPPLDVRKDARGTVYVDGATEREVNSHEDLLATISEGQGRRHVAATAMNADSSRSHLIFIIVVESTNKKTKQVSTGKLTLCDLAGSERLKKSEVSGEQKKEAQSINKSLTALGDVIEALTKQMKHIPYRNHKLTQLLSDSLGGNAKTLMFVNCSPVQENGDETNSSLSYAARAKLIVNKVEKNQESQEVARLKKVIQVMNQELEQAKDGSGRAPVVGTTALPESDHS